MLVPLSASHAHSLANLRKTPDEVVAEVGADPRGARRGRLEDADRRRRRHRLRLHAPGRGRAARSAALHAGAARRRRRPGEHRRHRRLCRPGRGARAVRAGAADRRRALLVRPLPRHARPRRWPTSMPRSKSACTASTPAWPASAAARTRRARAATRRPKTWPSCSASMGIDTGIDIDAAARAARQGRRLAGRRNAARRAVARRPAEDLRRAPPARCRLNRHDTRTMSTPPATACRSTASASSNSPTW